MSNRFEHAIHVLKQTGVRMTPQRHAILAYLMESRIHPSVDEIYKALDPRFPNMSVATIYNNLKVFLDAGLVKELTYGDGAGRYDADMSDHYHAICENCGTIVDFEFEPSDDIERIAAARTGFRVKGHRMEVYGVCGPCSIGTIH